MSNIDKQTRKEAIISRLASSFEPGSITDTQVDVLSDTVDLINVLFFEADAAEKRIAEMEAVKCKFSDSKLLSLAKDIVENLVDTGGSDPEYTKQYVDWTCKRIRIAAAGK